MCPTFLPTYLLHQNQHRATCQVVLEVLVGTSTERFFASEILNLPILYPNSGALTQSSAMLTF